MNTLTCFNPMCDDPLHKHALDTFYDEISLALYASSYKSIPLVKHKMIIIDEFQINEINVDLRTSGFDNEVLSVDACAV